MQIRGYKNAEQLQVSFSFGNEVLLCRSVHQGVARAVLFLKQIPLDTQEEREFPSVRRPLGALRG